MTAAAGHVDGHDKKVREFFSDPLIFFYLEINFITFLSWKAISVIVIYMIVLLSDVMDCSTKKIIYLVIRVGSWHIVMVSGTILIDSPLLWT